MQLGSHDNFRIQGEEGWTSPYEEDALLRRPLPLYYTYITYFLLMNILIYL